MGWIYSEHRHTGHCQGFFSAYIILTCVHIDTWRQSVYSQAEACTWFCWERNFHPQVFFFFFLMLPLHRHTTKCPWIIFWFKVCHLKLYQWEFGGCWPQPPAFLPFQAPFSQLILKTIQLHRAIRTIHHHCCFYIRGHFYEVRPLSSSYKHF